MNSSQLLGRTGALTTALVLVLALSGARAPAQESPTAAYNRAKLSELTDGNLAAAIALYEKVINDQRAIDGMKAKAYYRLGLCHVKSGATERAREMFDHLIAHFPTSDEAVQAKVLRLGLQLGKKPAAPARDLTYEAQALLVKAATKRASHDAIKSLVFMGDRALPTLRRALKQNDAQLRAAAMAALAQLRPREASTALIAAANERSFRYANSAPAPKVTLTALLQREPTLAADIGQAYKNAATNTAAKVNLLRILVGARRFDLLGNYRRHVDGTSFALRDAAWSAWIAEAISDGGSVAPVLDAIEKRWSTDDRLLARTLATLVPQYTKFDKSEQAKFDRLATRAALKSEARGLILNAIAKKPAFLQVFIGLLNNGPTSTIDDYLPRAYRSVAQPRLMTYANALITAARKNVPHQNKEAAKLLRAVGTTTPYLTPKSFQELATRLLTDEALLRQPDASGGVPHALRTVLFGHSFGNDVTIAPNVAWTAEEKYLPVYVQAVQGKLPESLRTEALRRLEMLVRSYWPSFSDESRANVVRALLAAERPNIPTRGARTPAPGRYDNAWLSAISLLSRCDDGIDIDTYFRIRPFRRGESIPSHFSEQNRIEMLRRIAGKGPLAGRNFSRLLTTVTLKPAERDQLIRDHWQHVGDEWLGLVERLQPTEANLEFVIQRLSPADRKTLAAKADNWVRSIDSPKVAPLFIALLERKSPSQKISACVLLQSLADPAAVPKLIELLAYRDADVRKAAEKALQAIRRIKTNQDMWREWYRKQMATQAKEAKEAKSKKDL